MDFIILNLETIDTLVRIFYNQRVKEFERSDENATKNEAARSEQTISGTEAEER